MAETFTLDDFQDTKQQAPLNFDESDFAPANSELKSQLLALRKKKSATTLGELPAAIFTPSDEQRARAAEQVRTGTFEPVSFSTDPNLSKPTAQDITTLTGAKGRAAEALATAGSAGVGIAEGLATSGMIGAPAKVAGGLAAGYTAQMAASVPTQLTEAAVNYSKGDTQAGDSSLINGLVTAGLIAIPAHLARKRDLSLDDIIGKPAAQQARAEAVKTGADLQMPKGATPQPTEVSNASGIPSPEIIPQPEIRTPVGETAPLRQQGEVAQPRPPETPANAPEQSPLEVPKVEGGLAPAEKFKKIGDDLGFTYDADFGLGEKKLHQFTFRNLPKDDPAYGASFYAPVGATAEEVTTLANKKAAQFRDAAEPPQVPVETPPAPAAKVGKPASTALRDENTGEVFYGQPTHGLLHDQIPDFDSRKLEAGFADKDGNFISQDQAKEKTGLASGEELFVMSPKQRKQYFDFQRNQLDSQELSDADKKAAIDEINKSEAFASKWKKPAAPAQEGKLPKQMFARIKGTTQTFPVESLDDAARKYSLMRVKSNAGASQLPPVDLLDEKGKQFARISYNGKVWDMGGKLLYDPFAKQIEPPSPSVVKPSPTPAAETGKASGKQIEIKVKNPYGLAPEGEKILTVKGTPVKIKGGEKHEWVAYKNGKYWSVVEKSSGSTAGGKPSKTRAEAIASTEHALSGLKEGVLDNAVASATKLNPKPESQPVAPTEKVSEQSPEQVLENHPSVKVTLPKSATMVRVTDAKGNQYVTSKKEIESGNVYHGAGVKKVEAGTIGKDKKFIPGKEPVTIEAKPKLVGLGAALAGETAPNPNSPTSIKNAQVDIERAKRGLPPAMQPQRRAFGQVWDEAMAAVDRDPGITDRLVDELKDHPRSVSDFEDALLLHKQIELQNDYGTLTRDLAQAYEDAKEFPNRQADVDELNVRVAGLSDRMQELYDINKKAGTETARGLNARKMMAYEDYSLAAMELQKRAANQGRPLSEGERVELQKTHDKIAELQKQYDDLVAKNAEKQTVPEIENVLKQTKARTLRGSTEELAGFDKTKEKIGAALEKGDRSSINGLVQKLVRAFVEENPAIQRDELVDKVHGVLREFDPEFSRRDTMDAISGYGDFKPLRKDLISNTVRDLKGQLQQIGKLEDMAAGEAPKKTGVERRTPSDEERRLIKQVEEAKRKGGYKVTDPAAQLRTALQAVKTRLENQIKDLEFQLQRRQKIVRTRTPIALDAAAESLKARRDELKSQYDAMFPREPISDAQRLANWKTRTQNRIATLQDKLANGDFAKRPVRPPPELDAEAQKIQTELFRAKQNFQRGLIEDRLRQRPMWIKAQDTFLRWYRGGLLSSPVVFAKLTAAAIVRAGLTPVEEVVGGAISKALPKLAARAPREGYWNSEAEAKAITSHLTKGRLDAWDVLTKGETELDILYGKGREGALGENQVRPFSVADIPGRAHGAFKASTKRAEFERSLTKRLAYEIRNGADGSSPAVQLRSAIEAYKDANRSIFLQDNRVVSAWQAAIRRVEQASKLTGQPSPGGKTVGTIMRTAVPIVRVPSNIVAEALQFATGSVTGSARLGLALRQGIDTLPPEQADLIMRELKKGSLGGAVLITGFLLPHIWGGFYQANQKKKPGQIANNAARIGGVNIPASALHNPIFEVAQAGATARMIADKNQAAGALAIPMGAKAASLGLIEETPFIREMLEAGRAFNPNEQNAYFGELAKSMTVPQLVQWMATRGDVDAAGNPITRKPKTFMQHIEAAIPGLRENVPSKGAAANWAAP